ncbi:NusB antitermination factor [Herbihabitans rhizosphaerae]|uniref:Transcription antitermination protein NusB n=1 Tax=Herbihabitans rhizosphaerae TaxID=1872711 RepID=A0A4Q7L234_9PSEU|nr:transcription antitermination factor NusB [Herbihabitans rhizosphaerae]RZS43184.1 NusB antitermination factor [Herbihabitans rhizosphaerae]
MGARSKARKRAVDILYEADVRKVDAVTMVSERVGSPDVPPVNDYTVTLVEGVVTNRDRIDELLAEHSESWALDRMPKVDLAVLRLGLYELLWADDVPDPVAIDEAVAIAKSLSTDDSPRFVNGVLGRIAMIADQLRATR